MNELESTLEKYGDSISYLKIASAAVEHVDIDGICSLVQWTAVSVCVGWGVVEDESRMRYSWLQRLLGKNKKDFSTFARRWVTAVELPVVALKHTEILKLVDDFFPTKLVEVGTKNDCFDMTNSPSYMVHDVQQAQEYGADHIVLEWSAFGTCGIYHGNGKPNILAVHQIMEHFTDRTQCIIEWPSQKSQDIWRSIFWPDTHIGNIQDFTQVNTPIQVNFPPQYWDMLTTFRNKLREISDDFWFSWDDIARNEKINTDLMTKFPDLLALDDSELRQYVLRAYMDYIAEEGTLLMTKLFGN